MQQAAVLMACHPLKDGGTLICEVTNRKKIHLHNNLEPAAGAADELCLLLLSFKKIFSFSTTSRKEILLHNSMAGH